MNPCGQFCGLSLPVCTLGIAFPGLVNIIVMHGSLKSVSDGVYVISEVLVATRLY